MQMLPSQLVSASQKHMFQSPLDRHGGGGPCLCIPARGLHGESSLARNYLANRWEEGKEEGKMEKVRAWCECVEVWVHRVVQ